MTEAEEAWKQAKELADKYRKGSQIQGMAVAGDFEGSERKISGHHIQISPSQLDWTVTTDDIYKAKNYRPSCPISRSLYAAALAGSSLRKAWENVRGIGAVIPAPKGGSPYSPIGPALAWISHHQGIRLIPPTNFSEAPSAETAEELSSAFEREVAEAQKRSRSERLARLAKASKKARKVLVQTTAFIRNPDVVAEVLERARGRCEACKAPAPFHRAHTGEPYLEVHHLISLASNGDDSVENALALCPNCHRKSHYG